MFYKRFKKIVKQIRYKKKFYINFNIKNFACFQKIIICQNKNILSEIKKTVV